MQSSNQKIKNISNQEFRKIFKIKNANYSINQKINEGLGFKISNLRNILTKVQGAKFQTSLTHFLKFNSMYFSNDEERKGYTRKFYEVYSSFLMMLEIADYIKSFLKECTDVANVEQNFSKDIQIRENINMNTPVFKKENVDNTLFSQLTKHLFNSNKEIPNSFNEYKTQRGLMTLSDNNISNITLFETLFLRYNNNQRLLKIIPSLIKQYNIFKSKIFDILCDNKNKTFDYGLLGFGFLFAYEDFPNITQDEEINVFINKQLYDMAIKNINIENEIKKMISTQNNIGLKLASSMDYFFNNSYRDANFYDTLIKALDMDIYGLKFALFYINPKFLEVFLKRKYKIDKQIYNYLQSYDVETESSSNIQYEDPTSAFINPSNTFFRDFNDFF